MRATTTGLIVAWLLAAAALFANVAGYAFNLYQAAWWFDRVLHAGTLFALTYWSSSLLLARGLDRQQRVVAIVLLAAFGIAAGALWELTEWGYDMLQPTDVIKGKHDTMLDIVMDSAGAIAAAVCVQAVLVSRSTRVDAGAPE